MAEFLTIDEVLSLVPCMTRANLATMRHNGDGPEFYKPTARTVLYDRNSVMSWVKSSAADMGARRRRAAERKAEKAKEKEMAR